MTAATDTLLTALEACDMLEIDGLHAFDFTLDEQRLLIECMDGRAAKRWSFTLAQLQAATFDPQLQSWTLVADSGEHRLVCMSAFSARDEEESEHEDA
ncbi:hypothetical protein GV819_11985 [Pseudomonas sp. Fl5BN2]|uniref:DUF5629 family protein n=1 Tax=unclassified Pseudomonas TaxID=196821 RepID=UPI0013782522|nr:MULTISPECIES: DUF5629 family protein [unclassified Pseudomonas]NBF03009.1 hypothetical protein [Pseudomonas sp. Fl5BN2]NBF12417.1 hypothetical protein [Pseudomonas sp. Fl4BN1]